MANQVGKKSPKRSRPSFITSILMVALVLFILGLIGLVVLHFQEMTRIVKENIQVSIYLQDNMNEVETVQLQKKLETERYVKSSEYISKDQAIEKFIEKNPSEKDFMDITGYNPLPASIDLFLNAEFMNNDSILVIEKELQEKYGLEEEQVKSDKKLIRSIDENLRTAGLILIGIAILFIFIVIVLIDSTVRLSMYSKRFLIKSMQLVGANRWFITKPYMMRSILNGFISGIIAVLVLSAAIYLAQKKFAELALLQNYLYWALLFIGLIVLGILISWWSTYRSVTKYLRMKLDELY